MTAAQERDARAAWSPAPPVLAGVREGSGAFPSPRRSAGPRVRCTPWHRSAKETTPTGALALPRSSILRTRAPRRERMALWASWPRSAMSRRRRWRGTPASSGWGASSRCAAASLPALRASRCPSMTRSAPSSPRRTRSTPWRRMGPALLHWRFGDAPRLGAARDGDRLQALAVYSVEGEALEVQAWWALADAESLPSSGWAAPSRRLRRVRGLELRLEPPCGPRPPGACWPRASPCVPPRAPCGWPRSSPVWTWSCSAAAGCGSAEDLGPIDSHPPWSRTLSRLGWPVESLESPPHADPNAHPASQRGAESPAWLAVARGLFRVVHAVAPGRTGLGHPCSHSAAPTPGPRREEGSPSWPPRMWTRARGT